MIKQHAGRDLIFEEKRQKSLEKKLGREFIRINTRKRHDKDYEIGRIQTFISTFKDRQLKQSIKKIKRTRRQNRKIQTSNHSIKWIAKFKSIKG